MAWLERLAANQGAKPEELLTRPEDRPETTPDWIQKVSNEQPVADQAVEEPVAKLEDHPETTPEWIQQDAGQGTVSVVEPPAPAQPVVQESGRAPSDEDVTITSWLSSLDKPDADSQELHATASVPDAVPTPQEELPDWLKDLEKPAPVQNEPEPASAAEPPKSDSDLPDWLKQPASPGQTHMLTPMAGEVPASTPEMPAWMDEATPVAPEASPTVPEEWVPAEKPVETMPTPNARETSIPETTVSRITEVTPPIAEAATNIDVPAPIPSQVRVPETPPELRGTSPLAHVPAQDKDAELLTGAQAALQGNAMEDAMKGYTKLIKKGRLLDEVIHDLREALYRYPVDVVIWQTLGDAYMRANRLQDALDSYTKAEELLR